MANMSLEKKMQKRLDRLGYHIPLPIPCKKLKKVSSDCGGFVKIGNQTSSTLHKIVGSIGDGGYEVLILDAPAGIFHTQEEASREFIDLMRSCNYLGRISGSELFVYSSDCDTDEEGAYKLPKSEYAVHIIGAKDGWPSPSPILVLCP